MFHVEHNKPHMIRLKSILAGCFFMLSLMPAEELKNRLLYNNINKFLY